MYTYFNPTRKVLCAMQVVEDAMAGAKNISPVFPHDDEEKISESEQDSVVEANVPDYNELNYGGIGKAVKDLVEEGIYVDNNGHVIGTLKSVDEYTGFNSAVVDEQSGYYFPFEINVPGAKTMTFEKTSIDNGTYVKTKTDIPYDTQIILRVADPMDEDGEVVKKIYDFRITTDNDKVIELHFDKVKFAEA